MLTRSRKKARSQSSSYSKGQSFGPWTLIEQLGAGGNGEVWKVCRSGSPEHAIKLLRAIDATSYARFQAEVTALDTLAGEPGVIPMVDRFIPARLAGQTPWFVMPVAVTFDKYEAKQTPKRIVEDFVDLSVTLEKLHRQRIYHRDIKPANLLYRNDRLCFSDFGLVKYPKRAVITPKKRDVGPKFTMAPEMRRYASAADGGPADVYSFCKTLWIALTKQPQGFDGQYTTNSVVSLKSFLPQLYTTTLDQLFIECTDNDPHRRPDIKHVSDRLKEWLTIVGDFHIRNQSEWTELQHTLFPSGAPTRATWDQIDAICSVLGEIAKVPSLNHMFYPSGGGNTITGVSRTAEDGLIALHVGEKIADLLKPKKLTYESFGTDPNWNYFRLEAAPIEPTGVKGALDSEGICETVTEVRPGEYIPYHHWDHGEYQGEPLPSEARPIGRYLNGSFVFFGTRSTYNLNPGTYDARHNGMTEDEFRSYIQRNAIKLSAKGA